MCTSACGSVRNVRIRDSGETEGKGTRWPREKSRTTLPQKRSRGRPSGAGPMAPSTGTGVSAFGRATPSTGTPSSERTTASSALTRLKGAIEGEKTVK